MLRILTTTEVLQVRAAAGPTPTGLRDRAIVALAYGCGLRAAEISAADCRDVDFRHCTITVPTAKQRGARRRRTVPIPALAQCDLRDYLTAARPALITTAPRHVRALILAADRGQVRRGHRISRQSIRYRVKALFRRAGIDVDGCCCHALRHAFATHTLHGMRARTGNGGWAPADAQRQLQLLLGHESLRSTGIYFDVGQEELAATVNRCHPWGRPVQLTLGEVDQ